MAPNAILTLILAMSIMGGVGFGASTMDLDNDGIANCEDPDDDSDGLNDTSDEYPHDHDNDGIPDCKDDDDNDGINDTEDDTYVGNCSKPKRRMREPRDLDSDGIADCEDPDDDGDGINDTKDEYPHDHDNDNIPDCKDYDDDNDGINDTEDDEYVGNCSKHGRKFGHRRSHEGLKKNQEIHDGFFREKRFRYK